MVSVTFTGIRAGTCSWCRKEKNEVFLVSEETTREPRPWCWRCLEKKTRNELEGAAEKSSAALAPAGADASGRSLS
jgi:hypothetical protein